MMSLRPILLALLVVSGWMTQSQAWVQLPASRTSGVVMQLSGGVGMSGPNAKKSTTKASLPNKKDAAPKKDIVKPKDMGKDVKKEAPKKKNEPAKKK